MTLVKSWISETGLPCAIVKHSEMAHLCGYVGVGQQHSWYGKFYLSCTLPEAKPRGELPEDFEGEFPIAKLSLYHKVVASKLVCGEEYCSHTPESIVSVHGGITYSDWGFDPIPRDGEWWFGFDCAHAGDRVPGMDAVAALVGGGFDRSDDVYRDEAYVAAECENMAKQLIEVRVWQKRLEV